MSLRGMVTVPPASSGSAGHLTREATQEGPSAQI